MTQSSSFHVLLFAGVRDAAACDSIQIDVDPPVYAAALMKAIAKQIPAAAALIDVSRLAVDGHYVAADHLIDSVNVELALIPPVSGG